MAASSAKESYINCNLRMRLVLQNNSTSLYFCMGNQWTPSFKEAYNFGSLNNAAEFLRHHTVEDVQLVLIDQHSGGIEFMPYPLQRLLESHAAAVSTR